VAVTQTPPIVSIAMGAIDKALAELKATGRMTEAQTGAVSRATREKVEQVEELDARARKYNLPKATASGSGAERQRLRNGIAARKGRSGAEQSEGQLSRHAAI